MQELLLLLENPEYPQGFGAGAAVQANACFVLCFIRIGPQM
jgi:hypothetical protein